MTLDDTLDLVVGALHRADVDFMVTGSLASSYHGMPRSTQDIDLVVEGSEAQLLDFGEAIARKDFYVSEAAIREAVELKGDLPVEGARGLPIWIATAEDVILAKLEWAKRTGSEFSASRRRLAGMLERNRISRGGVTRTESASSLPRTWQRRERTEKRRRTDGGEPWKTSSSRSMKRAGSVSS